MIAQRFCGSSIGLFPRAVTLILLAAALAGCKSDPASMPAARATVRINGEDFAPRGRQKPQPLDQTLKSDPCAARLHAISGAMLEYYALNNRLPRTLTDLQSLADLDDPLTLTCPETGKPYQYVPAGLQSPEDARQIIVVDSAPNNSGLRWAILMQRARGRQPAAMWVMLLTDPVFQGYVPALAGGQATTRRAEGPSVPASK